MSDDRYLNKRLSNPETQEKMSDFFKQKKAQNQQQQAPKSSMPLLDSYPNNFSEVTENKQEENEEDQNILNVLEKHHDSSPKKGSHPPRPGKPQRPASVKRPHQFNKLPDSEKEKIFLTTYDENLKLKERQRLQEQQYGQMEVKFRTMEKNMNMLKNQLNGPKSSKGNAGFDEDTQKLRYTVDQKDQEIEKLKQKIMALSNAHKVVSTTKTPLRKIVTNQTGIADHQQDMHKMGVAETQIKDLLKLNDMLKKRCLEQESQIRSMQAMMNSKIVTNKELSEKNQTFVTLKERYEKMEAHVVAVRNQLEDERKRQNDIMQLLRDEREKTHQLEQQVRSMELMAKSAQDLNADLMECKRQKNELENKLNILMESPFFKDYNERATVAAKMKQIETEYSITKNELKLLKDQNIKLETENAIKSQDLREAQAEIRKKYEECTTLTSQLNDRDKQLAPFKDLQYWDNDQFLKVLGNLKWTGEEPAWRKIEFIDRQYLDSDDPNLLRKEIEHLKLEKGELAAHLEKTQTLLKTRQDIELEKDRLHKIEIEKLSLQLKAATAKCTELAKIADLQAQSKQQRTLFEAEGVKYDDNVSVFSVDAAEDDQIQPGENFFDLFMGEGQLEASGVNQSYQQATGSTGILDTATLLTFLTIDFYDHETQHTSVSEGLNCVFNLQVSFKVNADGPLIQYLESGYLKVELYMSQGSDAIKLATGLLTLRELVVGNYQEGVSRVMKGTITFNGYNNQFVGIVNFRCRMRQPISQIIKWLKDQRELDIQDDDEMTDIVAVRKRKLVVVIDKATNLDPKSNTFVYYSLDNKDFNTSTQPGKNPKWDYRMVHEVVYNEEFATTLKRNLLDLYLIDDNQPLTSELQSDKIGVVSLDISPLVQGDSVDIAAEIRSDRGDDKKMGALFVKVFWYETKEEESSNHQGTGLIQQSWEEQFTNRIATQARSLGITCRQTFRMLDQDDDKVISIDEFNNGLRNLLNIKANQQEVSLYYSKLPQPLNLQNFESVFARLIFSNVEDQSMYFAPQQTQDLGRINQFIQSNTQQLYSNQEKIERSKKMILDVFQAQIKKGQTRQSLFNEIDSVNPDGFLTVREMSRWLIRYKDLPLSEEEIAQVLMFYMDIDRDNKVNSKEFQAFLTGGNERQAPRARQGSRESGMGGGGLNPLHATLDTILNYAAQNNYTLMRVREIMDQNRDGFITRDEMSRFLDSFGVNLNQQSLNTVMDHFDINRDGRISIQEFADALSSQNKNKNIVKQVNNWSGVSSYMIGYLTGYMQKMNVSLAGIFNEIDIDMDGYLSRKEMREVFRTKIIIPLDADEFETFFKQFDKDNDGRISIREFVGIMQPAIQSHPSYDPMVKSTNERLLTNQLQVKLEKVLEKHSQRLMNAFEKYADRGNLRLVTTTEFRRTLLSENLGFSEPEIQRMLNELCTVKNNQVDYVSFCQMARKKSSQAVAFDQTSQSAMEQSYDKGQAMTRDVFRKLQKNMVKGKHTKESLFKLFDIDKDQKITKDEMIKVFGQMKLSYNLDDIDLIFATLDRRRSGSIELKEFVEWLEL